jgi:putative transposase
MLKQLTFRCFFHGGERERAGRKPKGKVALVPHQRREEMSARDPLHITVKLKDGLPSLRGDAEMKIIRDALRAVRGKKSMRIIHFVVIGNHVHMIIEAEDRESVASGMNGLLVRITKRLNKLWKRSGKVLADRYHDEVIGSPRQARNVLSYVLNNAKKHGIVLPSAIDPCTSGIAFDGWAGSTVAPQALDCVVPPSVWLLCVGWRKHGLIGVREVPSS